MPAFSDSKVRSIQSEREETRQLDLFMPQEEVDRYVDDADDRIVECRERGRHPFPTARETGLRFNGVDPETGLMMRRVMCPCCGLAERIEFWDVRHNKGRVTRCELVSGRTTYRAEYLGDGAIRRYTAPPGHGRMKPKQVKNAVATGLLGGTDYAALRKEAMQAERERAKAK